MPGNIYDQNNPDIHRYQLDSKKLDLDAGILGRLFGSKSNAQLNIAGFTLILAVISGVAAIALGKDQTIDTAWKYLSPIITTLIGFIIGRKSN